MKRSLELHSRRLLSSNGELAVISGQKWVELLLEVVSSLFLDLFQTRLKKPLVHCILKEMCGLGLDETPRGFPGERLGRYGRAKLSVP